MDITIILVSTLVIFISILLLSIIYIQFRPKKPVMYNSILFTILIVATGFLIYMFKGLSPVIRDDILGDFTNVFNYSSLVSPVVAPILTTIGILIGYGFNSILKYIRTRNFKSKFKKKK